MLNQFKQTNTRKVNKLVKNKWKLYTLVIKEFKNVSESGLQNVKFPIRYGINRLIVSSNKDRGLTINTYK